MLTTLLVWLWLGLSSFLWGDLFFLILNKKYSYKNNNIFLTIILGLCFLTVFAEIFSIFYKIGLLASICVLIVDIVIFCFERNKYISFLSNIKVNRRVIIPLLFSLFVILVMSKITSLNVRHYDTYLYHAQSVRWIEEYGVVKGIGNLHFRLAYNSAIFSLEALFSMKFLCGQSLHAVNGFIVCLLVLYSTLSLKVFNNKKVFVSDFVKLCIPIYFISQLNIRYISSLGSDFATMGFIMFVLSYWISCIEEKTDDIDIYCILSLICVYIVSIKLSGALIVLLAIKPAYELIREKDLDRILFYIILGLVIIFPFLIRNILISGYLIYPLPELDLFGFDWKMSPDRCVMDRNFIKIFGWANGKISIEDVDKPFSYWYPYWKEENGMKNIAMFWTACVCCAVLITIDTYKLIRKKDKNYLLVTAIITADLLYWFISAPLFRYGFGFIIVPLLYLVGRLSVCLQNRISLNQVVRIVAIVVVVYCCLQFVSYNGRQIVLLKQIDYDQIEAKEVEYGNNTFFVPIGGEDTIGYYNFPAVIYETVFDTVEYRGENIADGFRLKAN